MTDVSTSPARVSPQRTMSVQARLQSTPSKATSGRSKPGSFQFTTTTMSEPPPLSGCSSSIQSDSVVTIGVSDRSRSITMAERGAGAPGRLLDAWGRSLGKLSTVMPQDISFSKLARWAGADKPSESGTSDSRRQALVMLIKPRYVIDPRKSKYLKYWDSVAAAALIFTALVTPLEVGFLHRAESADEPIFVANRVVDVIFLFDVFLQFFIAFPKEQGR